MCNRIRFFLVTVFFHASLLVYAHGDLHQRIEKVSKLIAASPNDLELYQQRGELYLRHRDYRKAKRDLARCEKGGVANQPLWYAIARAHYHLNKERQCRLYLEKSLAIDSNHLLSLHLSARLYSRSKAFVEAAHLFEDIIKYSVRTIPENYVDAALAWENAGMLDKAISILELGLHEMGPVPTFQKYLVKYYSASSRMNDVLKIKSEQVEQSHRKEFPLVDRAEFHLMIGNNEAGQSDLIQARQAIHRLPKHIQDNQATRLLKKRIDELITKAHL